MTDTKRILAITDSRTLRLYSTLKRVMYANNSGAAFMDAMDAFECHLRVKYGLNEQETNSIYFDLVEKELK